MWDESILFSDSESAQKIGGPDEDEAQHGLDGGRGLLYVWKEYTPDVVFYRTLDVFLEDGYGFESGGLLRVIQHQKTTVQ